MIAVRSLHILRSKDEKSIYILTEIDRSRGRERERVAVNDVDKCRLEDSRKAARGILLVIS
jgi:hypothetical protein